MELAQRGIYHGQDHVRAFLLKVFGRGTKGRLVGQLANHMQMQPVITSPMTVEARGFERACCSR